MKVSSLRVENFRNLLPQTLELGGGLNVFVGNNAQGKTNMLESIYLCCLGKSVRTDRDKELINWNAQSCFVSLECQGKSGERQISLAISKEKKTASVNGMPFLRIGELLGYFNCIYFSPDEIDVVTMSPERRRRFLDIDLCQLNKRYYSALVRFNKTLTQRNNLLKKAASVDALEQTLPIWDEALSKEGAVLTKIRKDFCAALALNVEETHLRLTKEEKLEMSYLQNIEGKSEEEIGENYYKKLRASVQKDFALRFTTAGCQRDDIRFLVNGADIRNFGSQGQQRTTALSLKLSELELFNKLTGEYPVLLLDDVLSELDTKRQRALLSFNDKAQIILTATKIEKALIKDIDTVKFRIKNGEAKRV